MFDQMKEHLLLLLSKQKYIYSVFSSSFILFNTLGDCLDFA